LLLVPRDARNAVSRVIARIISVATTRHGMQFAALPYRIGEDGAPQVMLVTSRETRRWVIPKGWPMKGLRPSRVAEQEAYEEAGLTGHIIGDTAIGSYRYDKQLPGEKRRCHVWVFLLRVENQLNDWPEKAQRETRWFDVTEAASLVDEAELGELIREVGKSGRDGTEGSIHASRSPGS
jgi:8-oxo-dGTP pyrophosphatase MutT (NUDIX family)